MTLQKQKEKACFFGQHIEGKVNVFGMAEYINGGVTWDENGQFKFFDGVEFHSFDERCQLVLRHLSSITDEEAIDVANLFQPECEWKFINRNLYFVHLGGNDNETLTFWFQMDDPSIITYIDAKTEQTQAFNQFEMIDYLRSKGFALPFCGIDPIKEGWAILENAKP